MSTEIFMHSHSPSPRRIYIKQFAMRHYLTQVFETEPQQGQTEALPSLNYRCSSADKESKLSFPHNIWCESLQHLYLHFDISRHIMFNFFVWDGTVRKTPGQGLSLCCSLQGLRKRSLGWQNGGGEKGSNFGFQLLEAPRLKKQKEIKINFIKTVMRFNPTTWSFVFNYYDQLQTSDKNYIVLFKSIFKLNHICFLSN